MYGKNKPLNAPSDIQAKEKLNLYVYEYLYHIGAAKAAQGFCADMKWEPNKMSLGEPPGFLLSWWCVFWDLYSAAPERRDQHLHSEEAKAFHDYGFINSNGMPPQPNPNPNGPPPMPMNVNEGMHNPTVPFFPPSGQGMMSQYPRYANPPPRPLVRMPPQPEYPGGPVMPSQMDGGRNGLRMPSPGARMPSNPIGHPGPGGPMPNPYRPQVMSPSMNQPGPRMHITNSPGVGYSSSSPVPYGAPCPTGHAPSTPTMMSSPQDSNSGEMQPYGMRNMPTGMSHGPNPMYHDPHLSHMPPDMTHHGSINDFVSEYDPQMKQSPNQQHPQQSQAPPPPPQPPDVASYNYSEDPSTDTNAILKLKESMQEEVKKFDKTPSSSHNDDYNPYGSLG